MAWPVFAAEFWIFSRHGGPVWPDLRAAVSYTFPLALGAVGLGLAVSLPLAIRAAKRPRQLTLSIRFGIFEARGQPFLISVISMGIGTTLGLVATLGGQTVGLPLTWSAVHCEMLWPLLADIFIIRLDLSTPFMLGVPLIL